MDFMKHSIVLGIDIGGSHITAALVDLTSRTIVDGSWNRCHIDSQGNATEIISAWSEVIRTAFDHVPAGQQYIGIGMPGPFDYEAGISLMKDQHKYDALYGLNVKTLLAEQLGLTSQHIRFINDAGCFLQGEVFGGAASGMNHVVGITLGTGLGSAVYHGDLAADADLWCSPFKDGIAEDYLSTRWFVKRYETLTGRTVKNVKEMIGRLPEEPVVQTVMNEFAVNLATFLTGFVRRENAEMVVLGGNIANAADLFMPALTAALAANDIHVPVKKAALGETAAIIGAASIWYEKHNTLA